MSPELAKAMFVTAPACSRVLALRLAPREAELLAELAIDLAPAQLRLPERAESRGSV